MNLTNTIYKDYLSEINFAEVSFFLLTILLSSNTHTCDMHGIVFFIDHYYVQDCNILELQRLITIPRKDN